MEEASGAVRVCQYRTVRTFLFGGGVCCLFCVFSSLLRYVAVGSAGESGGRERAWLNGAGGGGSGIPAAVLGAVAGGSRPAQDETRRDAATLKQQENENMDFVCVCACMCVYTFLHRRGCRAGPRPEAAPSRYE